MEIRVGDTVKIKFGHLATENCGEHIDAACSEHYFREAGKNYYKGTVIDISTHCWFGLIERSRPIYIVRLDIVDCVIRADVVKKVIRIKT